MKHTISPDRTRLIITADEQDRKDLRELEAEGNHIHSDNAMHEFFEPLTCNSDLDWTNPEMTGDLTDAPMLATHGGDFGCVVERWAFMDYQVRSVLEDLRDMGEVVFVGGPL